MSHEDRWQDDHLTQFFLLSFSSVSPLVLQCSVPPPVYSLLCFSSSTGLESGGVTLKEPASEGEIESSAPVTLRCHIDGHPRWVSSPVTSSSEFTGLRIVLRTVLKNCSSVFVGLSHALMFLFTYSSSFPLSSPLYLIFFCFINRPAPLLLNTHPL